jgi:hypothetical protein
MNLVTPKARAKHEPLFNEPASGFWYIWSHITSKNYSNYRLKPFHLNKYFFVYLHVANLMVEAQLIKCQFHSDLFIQQPDNKVSML